MSHPKILVKAEVLESLLTQYAAIPRNVVAEKAGISLAELEEMISENTEISLSRAEKLAKVFYKPWTVFLLDAPPTAPAFGQDNRTVANQEHHVSPEMAVYLEEASNVLSFAEDIDPNRILSLPVVDGQSVNNYERLAELMREHIGYSLEEVLKIKDHFEALRYWKAKIQSLGIYVSEKPLPLDQVRAFSMMSERHAIIVVSTKDIPYARIFSLFHELCHILLKNTGICDLSTTNTIEPFCNNFAASFLVSKRELADLIHGRQFDLTDVADSVLVTELSKCFKISKLAILTRLKNLGYITDFAYTYAYEERVEAPASEVDQSGHGNWHQNKIKSVGTLYSTDVFSAYGEGRISYQDVSRALGVAQKNLEGYRKILFGGRATHAGTN